MLSNRARSVFVIGGATASGKSALGMRLAEAFDVSIINADSAQVYREIPVLAAVPTTEDLNKARHFLYSIISGDQRFSVAAWLKLAETTINNCLEKEQIPLVIGGTGFYLRSLIEGISEIPEIEDRVRDELQRKYDLIGPEEFYKYAITLDQNISKFAQNDKQRIIRALEVLTQTGISIFEWHNTKRISAAQNVNFYFILVDINRNILYRKCDQRFDQMLEHGVIEEVERLLSCRYGRNMPVMKGIGVPEIAKYLSGSTDLETTVKAVKQSTRRYAKRQLTWFRHQIPSNVEMYRYSSEDELNMLTRWMSSKIKS